VLACRVGFTSGAAFYIAFRQFKHFFNLKLPAFTYNYELYNFFVMNAKVVMVMMMIMMMMMMMMMMMPIMMMMMMMISDLST
jgi:MFS superfamily sulfate permease-like transporter